MGYGALVREVSVLLVEDVKLLLVLLVRLLVTLLLLVLLAVSVTSGRSHKPSATVEKAL